MEHTAHATEAHPSNRTYVMIAVILGILTAMEVMVFYVEALAPLLVPILMVLMLVKFGLVVGFFMHLKFDNRILSGVFGWGLLIAFLILMALLALYGKFTGTA